MSQRARAEGSTGPIVRSTSAFQTRIDAPHMNCSLGPVFYGSYRVNFQISCAGLFDRSAEQRGRALPCRTRSEHWDRAGSRQDSGCRSRIAASELKASGDGDVQSVERRHEECGPGSTVKYPLVGFGICICCSIVSHQLRWTGRGRLAKDRTHLL